MTRKRTAMILGGALGVMAAALALAVALHDSGTAQADAPLPAQFTKAHMPDFGQHSTGWCWVAAAANSFWWYANDPEHPGLQDGLLGGVGHPWENIDPNSQNAGSFCQGGLTSWYDNNDLPQGYLGAPPIPGYRQLLSKIAQTTFKDLNQDGIKQPAETNYCYSEGVEKWDYLIGLRDYVNNYSTDLVVHDIIDPARCGTQTGMLPKPQNPPSPTFNQRDPCLSPGPPPVAGVPGVNQVVRPPTFVDYQTELSAGQDVLLWMETTSLETAHVVTGVGYNTVPNPDQITISDPWTHSTCLSHDDCWPLVPIPPIIPPSPLMPDHNNAAGNAPSPYNMCTVTNPGPNPKFTINCGGTIWTVVDMIFVSPREPTPYKCYLIGGPPIGESVELKTVFGTEPGVDVMSPAFLCEPALKTLPQGDPEGDLTRTPYKAYMIADTHNPTAVVDLETQFGLERKVEVGPAQFLWEPALKIFQGGDPEGDLSQTPYKCYAISDPAPNPPVQVQLKTQFGTEQNVLVGPAQLLCEPALRDGFGDMTASPYKCYQISGQPLGVSVGLETHFGVEQGVVVNQPALLCDPAVRIGGVGGIAELPDVASDSGWPAGAYAALASAIAAAVLALGGGAWYARRRWVK